MDNIKLFDWIFIFLFFLVIGLFVQNSFNPILGGDSHIDVIAPVPVNISHSIPLCKQAIHVDNYYYCNTDNIVRIE